MKRLIYKIIPVIFIFSGCVEKEFDMNKLSTEIVYDPTLAFTIGTLDITIESLLKRYTDSSHININPEKKVNLIIETNLYSYDAQEGLPFPPQSNIIIPGFVFPSTIPGSGTVSKDTIINIPINFFSDAEIDSLLIKSLRYALVGSSTYSPSFNQELTISFLDMRKNSMVYLESFPMGPSVNVSNQNTATDYKLHFSNIIPGSATTRLYVKLTLSGTPGSPINPASVLNINMQINDLSYKHIYGYIGQPYLMDIEDTFKLDFLGRELAKNIEWKDPQISLFTTNSFIVPSNFFVESMRVVSYDGIVKDVSPDNSKIQNPTDIAYPTQIGKIAKDSVICTKTGYYKLYSSLENDAPKYLIVKLKSKANPYVKTKSNILCDTSRIQSKIQLKLSMNLRSSGFGQTDTMEFDMSKLAGKEENNDSESNVNIKMKTMLFRIVTSNQLPIDMQLQVYFCDENFQKLDSLYRGQPEENFIIKSGTIDPNTGRVNVPKLWKKDLILDENQLKKLENTKYIIYKTTIITTDYVNDKPFVTFFSDAKLTISFIAQIQPSIHFYDNK